jgi:sulfhydrogenase subunit beta (sulfur reductase)
VSRSVVPPLVGSSPTCETRDSVSNVQESAVIHPEALGSLVDALRERGYAVLGPTVRDGAIVYEELEGANELPIGWTDRQDGGTYRLERREDEARFGYAVGPHSWKQFLFPPRVRLWQARRDDRGGIEVEEERLEGPPLAFFGVRSCELHAIAMQDRIFVGGHVVDRDYASRRENVFVVAVNCFEPGGTCFCVSMGTGPKAESGYDLVLTEILEDGHRLLVEAGSELGAEILRALPARPAGPSDRDAAERAIDAARGKMGRRMEASDLRDLLARNLEHPRWDDVAERCLTCGNCTLVCPTCFCSTVEEVTDLEGAHAERWREWDSCFTVDHSYIHGGAIRPSGRSRYRQWMTHKLGTWHDQFGTSGCVGCGRCISWCPVGIDITEEVAAIRSSEEDDDARA